MSVSGIANTSNWISQLSQLSKTGASARSGTDNIKATASSQPGNGIFDAIALALSQVGLESTASANAANGGKVETAKTPSTDDSAQALSSFMQNLLAALQAQSNTNQGNTSANAGNPNTSIAGITATSQANAQNDLQSLIQKLSASTAATHPADSAQSALQQSFQGLVNTLGGAGGSSTLGNFLQAFAGNVPGASTIGSVISILA